MFALIGAIVLGGLVAVGSVDWLQIPIGVLILGCLVWFGLRYSRWITTNFVVTTDRLIYRHGVLAKHGIEIPLDRVNTVFFRQSVFERIVSLPLYPRMSERDADDVVSAVREIAEEASL